MEKSQHLQRAIPEPPRRKLFGGHTARAAGPRPTFNRPTVKRDLDKHKADLSTSGFKHVKLARGPESGEYAGGVPCRTPLQALEKVARFHFFSEFVTFFVIS
jgi:hypothetical protein